MFLQGAAQLSKLMVPTVTHKPTHHQCALFVTNLDTNLKHCIIVSRCQHDFAKVCAAVEVHGANCNARTDIKATRATCQSTRPQQHKRQLQQFMNVIHERDCSLVSAPQRLVIASAPRDDLARHASVIPRCNDAAC